MSSHGLFGSDLFGIVYISFAVADTVLNWKEFEDCSEAIHVWLLFSFAILIMLRAVHLATFALADGALPWFWRCMIVFSPCHCQVVFAMLFLYYTYWLFKGTLLYYKLISADVPCFDQYELTLSFIFLYAVLVSYATMWLIGLMSLCREHENEEHYQRLLEQYEDLELPPRIRNRHWDEMGLSPQSILMHPIRELSAEEHALHTCSICLEDIHAHQRVRELLCGHIFHIKCIDEWFVQRAECPNCNHNFREDAVVVF